MAPEPQPSPDITQRQQVKPERSQQPLVLNEGHPDLARHSRQRYELCRESRQTSRFKRVSSSIILFLSKGTVAIATHHRLSGLNNINLFAYSSENWKSKVRVPAGLASSEASRSGLYVLPTCLTQSVLGIQPSLGSLCVQITMTHNESVGSRAHLHILISN